MAIVAAAMGVAFVAYLPGLPGPLLLDDVPQLQGLIANSADDPATLLNNHIISNSGPFGRPVAMATFVASAAAHGPDIWWWKYENVMLHLIGGLLAFWFTSLLFRANAKSEDDRHFIAGAIVAAFWLLHPLHVSTVLYTVQRMTELSSLFVLAGLILYIKGRERQLTQRGGGWPLIALGFGLFFPLAVLSKESALLFPVFCSLIELFVFRFEGRGAARTQVRVLHGSIGIGCLLAGVYILANFEAVVLQTYAIREFSFSERVLTQLRVFILYLSQILLPVQSRMGFFHDDIRVSTSLFEPITTLFAAIGLVLLIGAALKLRTRQPLFAFGVLFFFTAHALESTIFSLELVFEHRNYLASLGILIAAIAILEAAVRNQRGFLLIVIVGLSGFSFLTWQRAVTWSSPSTMYQFMYYAHPQSSRLNLVLANIYTQMGNYAEARKSLATMTMKPGPAVHGLFLDCVEHGEVKESDVRAVGTLSAGWVDGHVASSLEVLVERSLEGECRVPAPALIALTDHLLTFTARSNLDKQSLLISKARILDSQNDVNGAVAALQAAHELRPDNAVPLYMAAHSLSVRGRLDEASETLTAAYEVERSSRTRNAAIARTVYDNVGRLYVAGNQIDRALATYAQAISLMPKEARFYVAKAELLMRQRQYDEAGATLATVRSLDPVDAGQYEYDIRRLESRLQEAPDAPESESR